ncbi:(p)ppGpp synthetase [Endozoicomonas montiporae]|uniref:GTP pyrophosphokinase n=2 Tax=Endozoicomonas montiporae TaxID=1027273 RepID=A0A081NAA5_9GAMM|nr:GTP diphosphokinase [Endozoicomonas montiporae]AMO56940.1 GTP pyrophosphokinase [Endozoicomonas montiporae CL-33]KEQ15378.1 (p)ppGpp synthetase [Endozoicomonas montiporae]
MVKVREDHPTRYDGSVDLDVWLRRLADAHGINDTARLREACEMSRTAEEQARLQADTVWPTGPGAYRTGLEMIEILAELKVDPDCLVAAALYRAVRERKLALKTVEEHFGTTVAALIKSVQGMAAISTLLNPARTQVLDQSQDQLEKVRKMLVSIIDDVRVALIKLAERTCAIRALRDADKEKRQRVAREVFEIYAPLAHRLGIGYIKWELEDLSFRYLKPQDYKKIARLLDEKRLDRQEYIDNVVEQLQEAMKEADIECEIYGRAKHIYSIWRKMKRKGLDFRELFDIRAFRIITHQVRDCYAALGVVHSLFNHIPQEFDDYIATPKENGYRSLHTAVFGPNGKTLEVQIRTEDMHEEAELGVCAHWKYKGTDVNAKSDSYEEKLAWLRQVMEWHEELGDLSGIAEEWRTDIEPDRIYVFTRNGHVVDLSVGATPVDFAFRIHSEVGLKCRGAKVGGRIVPLNHTLKTGDQVEILTASNAHPSRDWLNPDLGYVTTNRARAKITSWLKKQDRESNLIDGRSQLDAELKRLALTAVDLQPLLKQTPFESLDDMYAAIGAGDYRMAQITTLAQRELSPEEEKDFEIRTKPRQEKTSDSTINIDGVGNLLTQMAGCCQPVPGDAIIGYITTGRGVSIHRQDCNNALILQNQEPERLIEVNWGHSPEYAYPVEVQILAYDRSGLLRDITVVLANEKVNVLEVSTRTSKEDNMATMRLLLEVNSLQQLGVVLAKVDKLPNVIEAVRYRKEARGK